MNRYSLQEICVSGCTHYEIIDTNNKCNTVFTSKDYTEVINRLKQLEAMEVK